jgi:hypothetical protein
LVVIGEVVRHSTFHAALPGLRAGARQASSTHVAA